jgi:hypothetical protein
MSRLRLPLIAAPRGAALHDEDSIASQMAKGSNSAVKRMALCRSRRRNGLHVARVEYPDALPLALVDAGCLSEWDTENESEIVKGIERLLVKLSTGYSATGSNDDTV